MKKYLQFQFSHFCILPASQLLSASAIYKYVLIELILKVF